MNAESSRNVSLYKASRAKSECKLNQAKAPGLDQFTTCPAAVNSGVINDVVVEQVPPAAADWSKRGKSTSNTLTQGELIIY